MAFGSGGVGLLHFVEEGQSSVLPRFWYHGHRAFKLASARRVLPKTKARPNWYLAHFRGGESHETGTSPQKRDGTGTFGKAPTSSVGRPRKRTTRTSLGAAVQLQGARPSPPRQPFSRPGAPRALPPGGREDAPDDVPDDVSKGVPDDVPDDVLGARLQLGGHGGQPGFDGACSRCVQPTGPVS